MLLALDAGNTTISVCVFEDRKIRCVTSLRTYPALTSFQYQKELEDLLAQEGVLPDDLTGAVLSSVAGPVTEALMQAARRMTHREPLLVTSGVKTGLKMRLSNAQTLGSDLVCTAVGAAEAYPCPFVVADLGTATTITGVDRNGVLIGRSIMAGVGISLAAIKEHTAALPLLELSAPSNLLGMDTADAIRSGAVYGAAGMLDGIGARCRELLGEDATLLITGGYARRILPYCKLPYQLDETLAFQGLRVIFEKNSRK